MGYVRFWRRIRVAPGVTLNLSKRGVSTSFGVRGAHLTVGRHGVRRTVGIPGTGVYYTSLHRGGPAGAAPAGTTVRPAGCGCGGVTLIWLVVAILAVVAFSVLGGRNASTAGPPQATTPTRSASPAATPTPLFSPPPPVAPTAIPSTPALNNASPTNITSVTSPVAPGAFATLIAHSTPGTVCSITVLYSSGPSHAAGLDPKAAEPSGLVTWTWKVGARTAHGTYPIRVTCGEAGSASTTFTVS